jgi:hypothetical protein
VLCHFTGTDPIGALKTSAPLQGIVSRLADVGHLEIQWVELRNAGAWVHEFSMFTNNLGCVGSERLRV